VAAGHADQALQFSLAQGVVSPVRAVLAADRGLDFTSDEDLESFLTLQATVFVDRHASSFKTRTGSPAG